MTFNELITLEIFTCDARSRLQALEEADIITTDDYCSTSERFHNTWKVVNEFGKAHGIF